MLKRVPVNPHPNATVAGGGTVVGVLVVWLAGYFGVDLSAEAAVAITGVGVTGALFVGRVGVVGTWRRLLYGNSLKRAGRR